MIPIMYEAILDVDVKIVVFDVSFFMFLLMWVLICVVSEKMEVWGVLRLRFA